MEIITMGLIVEIAKLIVPVIITVFTFFKIVKKKDIVITQLMIKVSDTNDLLVESLSTNGDLLRELNRNFLLSNERILIDSENAANIMKTSVWNDFGYRWQQTMVNVFYQNHLDETEKTLTKIKGSTHSLLKSTLEKSFTINGFKNYLPELCDILDVLNKNKIYDKTLKLMITCKTTGDILHLREELYSLYQVTYSEIDK